MTANPQPQIGAAVVEFLRGELPDHLGHLDGSRRVALLRDDNIVALLTDEEAVHLGHLLVDAAMECDSTRIGRQEPTT